MKDKKTFRLTLVLLLPLLLLCLAFSYPPLQEAQHNEKIAVMTNSEWDWDHGWPETDYLSVLRETVSALDYLGYRYDLVNETIAQDDLNSYVMVISVAGTDGKKILRYCTDTDRTVFVLYDVSPELSAGLDITQGKFVLSAEGIPEITKEGPLTKGLVSEYGSLPLWGAYEHCFGPEAEVLLKNPEGLPVLTEQRGSSGRYVFLLTRALTWNAYSYRLLDNLIQEATKLAKIGGVPYAMDVPVIIRLDDFSSGSLFWRAYTDITRKLTIAAIMGQMDTEGWLTMAQSGVDIVPHGYNHEDLSTLTYQQQAKIIARTAEKYQQYAGQQPVGYIAPYNRINEDTTKACSKAGLLWITTYHGMARIPRHYYRDCLNSVWVLGARPEAFVDAAAVEKALVEGAVEQKPLVFVEHPSARNEEGRLQDSLSALRATVNYVSTHDGYYLTGINDYFSHLIDQKQVHCADNSIVVKNEIAAGLTFTYPDCDREHMMQLGSSVPMFYRHGSTVLPALQPGNYLLTPVQNMPVLLEPGPGVVIKSAVYYPEDKRAEVLLEAFVAKDIELTIDRMPAGSYLVELVQHDEAKSIYTASSSPDGDGRLQLPLRLPQDTMLRLSIALKQPLPHNLP
ncbi:MAG: polysaccharide deacetylase family protein [bacterium]